MAPTFKLTYFGVRALAEPSRYAFAYAGVPFEDVRIERPDWAAIKSDYPWESLPVLEVDGKVLAQSGSILRYLGREFNLAGENSFERAKCDEMIEVMGDLRAAVSKFWLEENEDKKVEIKSKLFEETFPRYLTKWDKILTGNNGLLVGKKMSIADFFIASFMEIFDDVFKLELSEKYPAIHAHQELVKNAKGIKEWIAERPKSDW